MRSLIRGVAKKILRHTTSPHTLYALSSPFQTSALYFVLKQPGPFTDFIIRGICLMASDEENATFRGLSGGLVVDARESTLSIGASSILSLPRPRKVKNSAVFYREFSRLPHRAIAEATFYFYHIYFIGEFYLVSPVARQARNMAAIMIIYDACVATLHFQSSTSKRSKPAKLAYRQGRRKLPHGISLGREHCRHDGWYHASADMLSVP